MAGLPFLFAAGLAAAATAVPVATNPVRSAYTTVELKVCTQIKRGGNGGAWHCPGLPGVPVYVAADHGRQFVSAGSNAKTRRAARQTLGAFNSIFTSGSERATIEWRFDRRGEQQVPYAMIIRFHTKREGVDGEVLVVYKVSATETCHAAHIDALANDNAIALARAIADAKAKIFDCRRGPGREGAIGRSPM
jgi:hypothetical protein